MQVKALKTIAGVYGTLVRDSFGEIPDEIAKELIKMGRVEAVKDETKTEAERPAKKKAKTDISVTDSASADNAQDFPDPPGIEG